MNKMRVEGCAPNKSVQIERVRDGIPREVEAFVGSICVLVSLPLLILLAFAIAFDSRGPVIFRQLRVGRRGRIFTLYKLRTMYRMATGPQITAADDERVTGIGRILRRTKLDELPQLWNIVKGDMSFVGPRPEALSYAKGEDRMWLQVLEVRPGLTDPTSLSLRGEEDLLAMIDGDRERFYVEHLQPFKIKGHLEYLQRRSWSTDVQVLWDTFLTIFVRRKTTLLRIDNLSEHHSGEGTF